MDPAGSSAGVSGSILTGLGFRSGSKKKARVESVYSRGASFKKVRKPVVSGTMIDSSAGLLYADLLLADGSEHKASWGSEVENKSNNVSEVSDLEDMENLVAEETSYIDSNASGNDDLMDDVTPRKTRTRTYVLDKPPKQPFFNLENDDNSVLELSPCMDQHRVLLYTLSVGTTIHDLSELVELYGEKTCHIGHNPNLYVHNRCVVICFGDEASKLAAIGTIPVFKDAQVAGGSSSCVISSHSGLAHSSMVTDFPTVSHLNDWLAILEHSLELLTDRVSGILV
ncbi:hypothetical protein G9A89_012197 [Geosiphon pyriformis]|nr:hypothetical protein G9A89_012197 [Geosiphon pyriformis]